MQLYYNDYQENQIQIINARAFLKTFYEEKATANFEIQESTKALLVDIFDLFTKEYAVNFLNQEKALENEKLMGILFDLTGEEIPFCDIDEKEFKELKKMSKKVQKHISKTLDEKKPSVFESICNFLSSKKEENKPSADNQKNLNCEYDALIKSAINSLELYDIAERTTIRKIKDFLGIKSYDTNYSNTQNYYIDANGCHDKNSIINLNEEYDDYDEGYEF